MATTTRAAPPWTKDPISGLYLANASFLRGLAGDHAPVCPVDGSAIHFYGVEKKGTSLADPILAWTGECVRQGHAFRVFND